MMLQTGYTTTTLYSVPIMVRGAVLGVLQFVNKLGGLTFTPEDGDTIDMFACYIGLALHHAKLYDKIRKSESKTHVSVVTVTVAQDIMTLQCAAAGAEGGADLPQPGLHRRGQDADCRGHAGHLPACRHIHSNVSTDLGVLMNVVAVVVQRTACCMNIMP